MTTINRDDLKEILEEIFDARSKLDIEEHSEQHEWIKARIQSERDRQEFYKEGVKVLIQYSLPVVEGAILYWLQGHCK